MEVESNTPDTQAPDVVVEEPSNLPSEQPSAEDYANFTMTDSMKAKVKDGRFLGRFNNLEDMVDNFEKLEVKHSEYVKNSKTADKDAEASIKADIANRDKSEATRKFGIELSNGSLSEESTAKIAEMGIDIKDVKLESYEVKEKLGSIKAKYPDFEDAIAWARENTPEDQREAINNELLGSMGEYAFKGLYADFKASGGEVPEPTRVSGSAASSGTKPYSTQAEMLADRKYINGSGRNDRAAIEQHNRRLNVSNPEIWGGN